MAVEQPSQDAAILYRELSILNTIAQALNRAVDLTEALQMALRYVAELLDLETAWIYLVDEETGKTYPAASQSLPPALAKSPRRMGGSCYCLDTYFDGDMDGAANVNVITCSRLKDLVDGTDGLRYHASIPLYARDKKLGVLNVASRDWRELSADDLRLLYTVGDLLSIAVERSRLYARRAEVGAVEERNRLAREIHDTVAQGLAALVLRLETADALLDSGDLARTRNTIKQALELTRANLVEVRRSVLDLRAAPLEGRNLPEALVELATSFANQWDIKVDFDVSGANHPLPVGMQAGLYRIAEEALTNVRRHAKAKHVKARIVTMPEGVYFTIEDDGRGFDVSKLFTKGHYGVVGMNERVKLLGGNLEIHSSPGAGTRIEVEVPLSLEQE